MTRHYVKVTDPQRAFERGQRDHKAGKPITSPPYADAQMAKAWELGWESARQTAATGRRG